MRKLRRLALADRTVRLRFTALYGALFLLSGVGLLVITNLVGLGSRISSPAQIPPGEPLTLGTAQELIGRLQTQLSEIEALQARQLLIGSAVALAVMAVVSVVLGRIVAGRVLRPLRTITATTRRISADNLHERLAAPGPDDEVKDLADTIDGLLERLEGSFAAQRRFVANASHELRTPLATMRASLDVAVAKPEPVPAQTIALAGRIRTELDQVDRLLEGFLMLARTQHGALSDRARLSLGRVVAAALIARAADITAKNLTVHDDDVHDGAWTQGSRTLLTRMADNVIDNAITHNHDGGWIRLTTTADGATALLVVETGGPVLDQEQVARLAQPFQRLGTDRTGSSNGSGLGLSIVAAIAAAHGGGLDLRARPEGGLRVAISLPLASARAGVAA
ncbi:cell wall metabolism sensor histidine kinase WalK [Nonomuraea sp. NEAU-A123]|uniref:sensor histidine kinase n=1 Tax=Nonomuraea sp. NEAU-A123 TaxID=2839649 RepID=UPI001BE40441|nr:HAMP domain-containing sensor histidine kinase [Nonomuraea sp. NEAU-A123]MBT2232397.1 HAMP domain-containing histidine kinase [Nonomuraea sp. NEAU-A123]